MAQQTLQTIVSIGGRVDNSFGQIGDALIGMGSQVDQLSQKIIDFGEESLETYTNYDDLMREVQAVGEFTDAEIAALDAINNKVAQTTTYSNVQAAEAEVLMGQYGMVISEIKEMLPDTLDLAMAGNISIANSIDYLYSSLKSLGLGIEYAGTLTDQMAKTAAIGATDIDTLGDSLTRLGSGAQLFKGGSVEILSILSEMSQFGEDQRGSQAGTWIRNFMLSLASPMGEVDDIVDAMEQLGIAQDEIDEYTESHSSGAASQAVDDLTQAGLQIYDSAGNLLPAIDIIKSLRDAVKGSGEYSDDFTELSGALSDAGDDVDTFLTNADGLADNALYNIFRRVFGRRGVTTALNLISISDEEWDQTMDSILNSDGFAESMADTMQGGLGGAQRELEATFTDFKTSVGEMISPVMENVDDRLKSILISVSDMDEGNLEAVASVFGVLAGAGPALLIAGGLFRLIGYTFGSAGGVAIGALAVVSAVAALEKLQEADMADNFGDMDLDMETLESYIDGISTAFTDSYTEVNTWATALDGAVEAYETASTTFAGDLLTTMLTGATLTKEEIEQLQSLGETMGTQLIQGAAFSAAESMSYWTMLFGGEDVAVDDPDYQSIISVLNTGYESVIATAEGLSQQLRDALSSAFEDGTLTADEYSGIMGIVDAYNEALAEVTDMENYVARGKALKKAQTAGFDGIIDYATYAQETRESDVATAQDIYDTNVLKAEWAYNKAIDDAESEAEKSAIQAEYESAIIAAQKAYDDHINAYESDYDSDLMDLWESALDQSDLSGVYQTAEDVVSQYLQGLISGDTAETLLREQYGHNYIAGETGYGDSKSSKRANLGEILVRAIYSLGGYDDLADSIAYYEEIGDTESASRLQMLQTMEQIVNGGVQSFISDEGLFGWFDSKIVPNRELGDYSRTTLADTSNEATMSTDAARAVNDTADPSGEIDALWQSIGALIEGTGDASGIMAAHQNLLDGQEDAFQEIVTSLENTYDFDAVLASMGGAEKFGDFGDVAAAYSLLYGSTSESADAYLKGIQDQELEPITLPIETDMDIGGAISEAQSMLDATPGTWSIFVQTFGSGSLGNYASASDDEVATGSGSGSGAKGSLFNLYADGGRADEASIFGEAGAEWAIPEEHSQRTADLLEAAAAASGFTWPELIDRNGGLNASANRTPYQLVYSPTIVASDTKGVKEELLKDKERLERWLEEKQLLGEVEAYV